MIALQEQPLARATRGLRAAVAALRSEPDPDRVLRRLTVESRRLVGADVTSILLRSEGPDGWGTLAREQRSLGQTPSDTQPAWPSALLTRVLQEQRPIWITDLETELPAAGPRRPSLGLRSVGLLPIISEGVLYAVAAVAWRRPRRVPEPERLLAEALAEQAGLVIELTALRGELEQGGLRAELSARAEGAEALLRVAAEVAGRKDTVGIAQDALRAVLRLHEADAGAFCMVEHESVSSLVHIGLPEKSAETVAACHDEVILDRPLMVTDIVAQLSPRLAQSLLDAGLRSMVCVPAISETGPIGALILCHRTRRPYRLHELALIEAFGLQLAGGLRLAQAYAALEIADRQREEFLALIAHELRHPVAAIATVAETLADTKGLNPKEQRALDGLRGQAQSLARLAEAVLDVARMETGMLRIRPSRLDLGTLVAALVREDPSADRLEIEIPERQIPVFVDPEMIGRCLDNLIRNALKYSPRDEPVLVRVAADEKAARIQVVDRGVGISETDVGRLFKKYGRIVNASSSGIDGIGLGLYLTRLLVEAHGGTITAKSAGVGMGATFTITLPLA